MMKGTRVEGSDDVEPVTITISEALIFRSKRKGILSFLDQRGRGFSRHKFLICLRSGRYMPQT
jgi:hypothetical protein